MVILNARHTHAYMRAEQQLHISLFCLPYVLHLHPHYSSGISTQHVNVWRAEVFEFVRDRVC